MFLSNDPKVICYPIEMESFSSFAVFSSFVPSMSRTHFMVESAVADPSLPF